MYAKWMGKVRLKKRVSVLGKLHAVEIFTCMEIMLKENVLRTLLVEMLWIYTKQKYHILISLGKITRYLRCGIHSTLAETEVICALQRALLARVWILPLPPQELRNRVGRFKGRRIVKPGVPKLIFFYND